MRAGALWDSRDSWILKTMTDTVIWFTQITERKETWTKGIWQRNPAQEQDLHCLSHTRWAYKKKTQKSQKTERDSRQGPRRRGNRPREAIERFMTIPFGRKEAASVKTDGSWLRRLGAVTTVSSTTSDWSTPPNTDKHTHSIFNCLLSSHPQTTGPTLDPCRSNARLTRNSENSWGQDDPWCPASLLNPPHPQQLRTDGHKHVLSVLFI